jgi:hypothetical protein
MLHVLLMQHNKYIMAQDIDCDGSKAVGEGRAIAQTSALGGMKWFFAIRCQTMTTVATSIAVMHICRSTPISSSLERLATGAEAFCSSYYSFFVGDRSVIGGPASR